MVVVEFVTTRELPPKLVALTLPSKTTFPSLSRVTFSAFITNTSLPFPRVIFPPAVKLPLTPSVPKEPLLPTIAVPASMLPLTVTFFLTFKSPPTFKSSAIVTRLSK